MNTTLPAILVIVIAGMAAGSARAEMDRWKGPDSQRCAVVNCSSPRPEFEPRSEDSEDTEPTETPSERYDRIHNDAIRAWNQAAAYTSYNAKMSAYVHVLNLLRQQQAIQDGPKVRDGIAQVEAMIDWVSGVLDAEKGDFASAVGEMMAAYQKRPDIFNEANYNYMSSVNMKYLAALPNSSRVFEPKPPVTPPMEVLSSAVSDRAFPDAPAGVSDRVRKGFQAVAVKDWKVARAWFQDALNLDPDNANLKSFIAIIDEPRGQADASQADAAASRDSELDSTGQPLPEKFTLTTLNEHAEKMSTGQVMNALDDILLAHLAGAQ